jgi:hypothetical protein
VNSTTVPVAWRRVSKDRPCPACGHDTWCTVATDGCAARCKREPSDWPRHGEDGDAWLHILTDNPLPTPRRRPVALPVKAQPAIDFADMAAQWQGEVGDDRLQAFADKLGVTPDSLRVLGCGWTGRGFAFPMFNAARNAVGIRLRDPRTGAKWSVRGGHEGVFLPVGVEPQGRLLIVEGATDAAAALTLGSDVIGRPSCTGATRITAELSHGRDVVVMVDADAPGRRGAEALATALLPTVRSMRVVEPPPGSKDLREWLQNGATAEQLQSLIEAQPIRRLQVTCRHD